MFEYLPRIKNHYDVLTPIIIDCGEKYGWARWVKPYSRRFNWAEIFSPIEENAWYSIRSFGKVPLYPQFPVDKYYVDFGNPYVRIGIECDGAQYHQNKEKDLVRDKVLWESGWRIYRISGSDCNRVVSENYFNINDFDDEEKKLAILKEFYERNIDGLLLSLHYFYSGKPQYILKTEYEEVLMQRCLDSRISLKNLIHVNGQIQVLDNW